jgi:hypothetical protein
MKRMLGLRSLPTFALPLPAAARRPFLPRLPLWRPMPRLQPAAWWRPQPAAAAPACRLPYQLLQ